jgi:predicted dehydrogenase
MNEALRVGLLGCGRAAERLHIPALERSGDFDLVAVADPQSARAKAMAGAVGHCASFESAREMLAQTPLDAMIIATPPPRHLADLELGAEAGLPMLVEKPMVVKIDDLDRLRLLGQAVPIMVGYNRRHWAPVTALKEAIGAAEAASLARCRMRLITDIDAWAPYVTRSDVLDDLATHQIDLAFFLFGRRPGAVSANWLSPTRLNIQLYLNGGPLVEILSAHEKRFLEDIVVTLGGVEHRLFAGSDRLRPARGLRRMALDIGDAIRRRLSRRPYSLRLSHDHQLQRFAAMVRGASPSGPDFHDAMVVVQVMEAARRSAQEGGIEIPLKGGAGAANE